MYSLRGLTGVMFVLMFGYKAKGYTGVSSNELLLTNQRQTLYIHNGRSVNVDSYSQHKDDVNDEHELDFNQTVIRKLYAVSDSLYKKSIKRQTVKGIVTYSFWVLSNTNAYDVVSVRLDNRYAITSVVDIGAGPVYYCSKGTAHFLISGKCSIDDRPSISSFSSLIFAIPSFTIGLSVKF